MDQAGGAVGFPLYLPEYPEYIIHKYKYIFRQLRPCRLPRA